MPKAKVKPKVRKRTGRYDPTRTGLLRKAMVGTLRKRFMALKLELVKLFTQEDAFGYKVRVANAFCATGPGGGVDPTCGKDDGGMAQEAQRLGHNPKGFDAPRGPNAPAVFGGGIASPGGIPPAVPTKIEPKKSAAKVDALYYGRSAEKAESDAETYRQMASKRYDEVAAATDPVEKSRLEVDAAYLSTRAADFHKEAVKISEIPSNAVNTGIVKDVQGLADIVGAPDNAKVLVTGVVKSHPWGGKPGYQAVMISVAHPQYTAHRVAKIMDDGEKVMKNESFFVHAGGGKGLGTAVVAAQVANLKAEGFDRIETWAARGNGMNGYYTWARMGYDQKISEFRDKRTRDKIVKAFPEAKSIQDVMATPEGRKWWRKNGTQMRHAKFDLKDGSRSLKVLEAYLAERAVRPAKGVKNWLVRNEEPNKDDADPPKLKDAEEIELDWDDIDDGDVENIRWALEPESEQLKLFKTWLKQQLKSSVVNTSLEDLWKRFHAEAYIKGAGRSFDDDKGSKDFNRDEFLRTSFGARTVPEKVNLMAMRSFSDLEGITDRMSADMVKILTRGFEAGNNPRVIARELAKQVDISLQRATTIARTEVIAAHAQGQLNALRALGVEKVGVMVEWSTAGDDRVCDLCSSMEGAVYTIDEAEGKIPAHPNCRCAFIPAKVGEVETDNALHTFERLWNVFCATGAGGGVDATCGKGGAGIPSVMKNKGPVSKMDKWQASDLPVRIGYLLEKGKPINADDIAALPLHIKQHKKLGGNMEYVKKLVSHKHPQQAEIAAALLGAKLVSKKDVPDVSVAKHTAPPASRPALTDPQKVAITEYTDTPMHDHLNTALWSGSSGAGIATHEHLQAAFQKVKTFKPVDTYRGIDIRDKGTLDAYVSAAKRAQDSGEPLTLRGYQSTSTGKPQMKGNVQIKIKAIKGLDAQPYTNKWKDENELLLNHNSKFKVTSVTNKGGTWHLEMEQLS